METTWDLAIISLHPLPPALDERIASSFKLILDIPQETLDVYSKWNARIQTVHADFPRVRPFTVPTTMPPDSRNLKISQLLLDFGTSLSTSYTGPVSQLNLLSFFPTPEARGLYAQYGKETATAGGRHGGRAKLGGSVLVDEHGNKAAKDGEGWDTIGIAQFPSIWHWIDMAGDPGYQEVNDRCRLTVSWSGRERRSSWVGWTDHWRPGLAGAFRYHHHFDEGL